MFRIAAIALCLTASTAQADTLVDFHHSHSHGYVGSFTNPLNYRPNRAAGRVVLRSSGYSEGNTVRVKRKRAGVTTGMSITPPQGITGQSQVAGLELQTLADN